MIFKRKIGGMIKYLDLEDFWNSLDAKEQQDLLRYDRESLKVGMGNSKGDDLISGEITNSTQTQLNLMAGFLTWADSEKNYELAEKLIEQGEKSISAGNASLLNEHFFLQTVAEIYYKQRDLREDAIEKTIDYCKRDIELYPEYSKIFMKDWGSIPSITTFQRLAILFEKQANYDDAISICELAIKYGLKDSTKGGYEARLEKLKKKAGKA